jgi:hypothetical protein
MDAIKERIKNRSGPSNNEEKRRKMDRTRPCSNGSKIMGKKRYSRWKINFDGRIGNFNIVLGSKNERVPVNRGPGLTKRNLVGFKDAHKDRNNHPNRRQECWWPR